MAILNETTINGNLSVAGEYLGNVVKANGVDVEDGTHQFRLGWNGTSPVLDVDDSAAIRTLLTKETDGGYIYHRTSGAAVMTVGLDSGVYYFRPLDESINITIGSGSRPMHYGYFKKVRIDDPGSSSYVPNTRILDTGVIAKSTHSNSSRTIKHDIAPLGVSVDLDAKKLYDIDIIQFKYNEDILSSSDGRYNKDLPGFTIEDLDEKYPIAIDKDGEDIKKWTWNAQYLIPPMLKLIQEQKKEIDELKEKVSNLEAKIN